LHRDVSGRPHDYPDRRHVSTLGLSHRRRPDRRSQGDRKNRVPPARVTFGTDQEKRIAPERQKPHRRGPSSDDRPAASTLGARLSNVALASISALIGYLLVECGYRYVQYETVAHRLVGAILAEVATYRSQHVSAYDPFTGHRYLPNLDFRPSTKA